MTAAQEKTAKKKERFTKEQWIETALEHLSKTGGAKIHIERLAEKLGVTKGSFYWHFESRADFVETVLDYWHQKETEDVITHMQAQNFSNVKEALQALVNYLLDNNLIANEVPVRSWAVQESRVADRVQKTDAIRKRFIMDQLIAEGHDQAKAEYFASVFTAYVCGNGFVLPRASRQEIQERTSWLIQELL
jgi:AcrR family transcriptional regulator